MGRANSAMALNAPPPQMKPCVHLEWKPASRSSNFASDPPTTGTGGTCSSLQWQACTVYDECYTYTTHFTGKNLVHVKSV